MKDDYGKPAPIDFMVLFGAEKMNYRYEDNSNKYNFSSDLFINYRFNGAFIRTGIGVMLSEDEGNYIINYGQYDSIGFYYGISSFDFDANNPDSIIFNYYEETVYDSINYSQNENTQNRYTIS